MHIHFLDPYEDGASPIHNLDPRVKLILTLAFILTAALAPSGAWPLYILLFAIILSVEVLSELGVASVLKRSLIALPFALAALPVIFTLEGQTMFIFTLGPWTVNAYQPGLERFISIALKSWLSVQAGLMLATSTPFPDLLVAMRAIKTPRLLVSIFGLMWRYLFVLADEVLRLMRARASRSGQADNAALKSGGGLVWRARVTGGMAGSLFLRAFERSDRIYTAMLSRGYDGEVRTLPLPPVSPASWLVLFSSLSLLIALLALSFLL